MRKYNKAKDKKIVHLFVVLILFCIGFIYKNNNYKIVNNYDVGTQTINEEKIVLGDEYLEIHFLDVGQSDCILLIQGEETLLIDAGNDENSQQIIDYIEKLGISDLDYIIGTHAHADHIGGLDKIVNYFEIGNIYFPKQTATTKNFEEFILAVKNKNMKLNIPNVGESFNIGDAKCIFLSPQQKEYEESNNYSIVVKVIYGNTSYLFMGDAETLVENELIESGYDLSADVLKIGHHGSNTSSSEKFLKIVNPKYGIISVGKDNNYNLPSDKIINRLNRFNINVLRTDLIGTIILKSDGNNILFNGGF